MDKKSIRKQKENEKEKIRKQKEDEKMKKQYEKEIGKSTKPVECLKLLLVFIDESIVNCDGNSQFLDSFTALKGPKYEINDMKLTDSDNYLPFSIKYVVKQQHLTYENESWSIKVNYEIDDQVILLIPGSEFIKLISNEPNDFNMHSIDELTAQIARCRAKATIILLDIDHELMKLKASMGKSKIGKVIEERLIDLQLEHGICSHKMSSREEAGKMAACYSKAIAEKQHKAQRRQKSDDLFTFSLNAGINCQVMINCAEGQLGGVDQLWRNQLMQFRGVTPEIADAIREKFLTPRHLFDSITDIMNVSGEKEAIESIANIEVRRGTEILATTRRVGKQISTRIFNFIFSPDDELENIF